MILRKLRALFALLMRASITLLMISLVCLALYVSVGRQMTPQVADYKDWIEQRLTSEMGMPVRIGSLRGEWLQFAPRFVLEDVTLGEPAALSLQQVSLAPAITESVRQRRLVIANTSIDSLALDFLQQTNGAWQLSGFAGGTQAPDMELIFQLLTRLSRFSLRDTTLNFTDTAGDSTQLDQLQLDFQSQLGSHLLSVQAQVSDTAQPLTLEASLSGSSLAQLQGELYVNLPLADYRIFVPPLSSLDSNEGGNLDGLDLQSVAVQAQLWAELSQGQLTNLVLDTQGDVTLLSGQAGQGLRLNDLRVAGLYLTHEPGSNEWEAYADDVYFELDGAQWPTGDVSLSYQQGSRAQLRADAIELGMVSRILQALPLDEQVISEVAGFNPRGRLLNLNLQADFDAGTLTSARVATNIDDGALSSFRGVPSFWGVGGYAEMGFDATSGIGEGFVEVDSSDVSMHIPRLFDQVWDYGHVNGRVGVKVRTGADANIRLVSGIVVAESDIVTAHGQFATEIQMGEQRYIDLELKLGALQADVSRKTPYLPMAATAPRSAQPALNWVERAVLQGEGAGSGLIFRGRVQRGALPVERTLQMFYKVADGTLKFDPDWPALEELDGYVLISDNAVDIAASAGSTMGIKLDASAGTLRPNPSGGSWLNINGKGRGSAAHGLQYLQQTPVTASIGQTFSQWQAEGDTDITLALSIPLNVPDARTDIALDFSFSDNRLYIPEYELQLEALSGTLLYTDDNGIQSDALQATVMGEPIIANIRSSGFLTTGDALVNTERSTELTWSGATDIGTLTAWPGLPSAVLPVLSQFEGRLEYQAGISVPILSSASPASRYPSLMITTDLSGVESALPAPFMKPAEQASPMSIDLTFKPAGPALDLRWQDITQMNLEFADGLPTNGLIYLGPAGDGLRVRRINPAATGVELLGTVAHIDYAAWQQTLAVMFPPTAVMTSALASGGRRNLDWISAIQGTAELAVGQLTVAGEVFDQLNLSLRRDVDAWVMAVQGEDVRGTLAWPLAGNAPWQVNLDYLHLGEIPDDVPVEEPAQTDTVVAVAEDVASGDQTLQDLEDLPSVEFELPREDPLRALDPRTFPSMQLTLGQFTLNGADFGQWQFALSSDGSGAVFRDLQVNARGLSIGNEAAPAEFRWIFDGHNHRSVLNGQLTATDLAPVLSAYGYAPSLQSTSAVFESRLHWDGSPAFFSALGLSGDIDINVASGRFQQRAGVANSALRLISIINFDAVVRRLRFSDDFLRSGLSYDEISGQVNLSNGIVTIKDRLQIIGPASLFQVSGTLDLAQQTIDANLFITLPVSENIPWLSGLAVLNNLINWQLAVGVFLFDQIFGEQVDNLTSAQYTLKGPWDGVQPVLYQVFASGS
ncbi:TIGR02099 family protein [Gammaproteobacteria bacterium LSUCC0112]|nr:TIGR02099 family protein [Gammaproteobacteria bacterium LSUCC0112]